MSRPGRGQPFPRRPRPLRCRGAGPARQPARAARPAEAHRRLRRRVLARQVRADQRDLLRRRRPPHPAGHAGRTTMCPVELAWDADEPPSLSLLPIETRLSGQSLGELRNFAKAWKRSARRRQPGEAGRSLREVMRTSWVTKDQAHELGWNDETPGREPAAGRHGPRRGAGLAPRAHQLPAPAAQAGPGGARHAGPGTPSAPSPS